MQSKFLFYDSYFMAFIHMLIFIHEHLVVLVLYLMFIEQTFTLQTKVHSRTHSMNLSSLYSHISYQQSLVVLSLSMQSHSPNSSNTQDVTGQQNYKLYKFLTKNSSEHLEWGVFTKCAITTLSSLNTTTTKSGDLRDRLPVPGW